MDKLKKGSIVLLVIIVMGVIPFVLGCMISSPVFKNFVGGDSWIGFWGSYLGSIVSGMITLFVLFKTLESNKKDLEQTFIENKRIQQRQEKMDHCDKRIKLSSSYTNDVIDELIRAKEYLEQQTEECYKEYNLARGKAVRTNNELMLTMSVKEEDCYYCGNKKYDDLCLKITERTGWLEKEINNLHKKIQANESIDTELEQLESLHKKYDDEIFKTFQNDFNCATEELVKNNLKIN